jgi:hypothetical protein
VSRDRRRIEMKHFDSLYCIEQIEKKDILPLVEQGKARLIHSSQGNHNPDFGSGIPNAYAVKVYELLLRTNVAPLCFMVNVGFVYDTRYNRGKMAISNLHAGLLYQAYDNCSVEEQQQTISKMIRYGSERQAHRIPISVEK